jgi:DNA-binding transcriptional regulator YhcF (GntR family)
MLDPQLSRTRSEPLYQQLADGISYAISTGRLEAGTSLPSLRDAGERWGVNLHTVRRAYAEIERAGLVRTIPRSGTVVLRDMGGTKEHSEEGPEAPDEFLARCLAEAERRYGLSGSDVVRRVARLAGRRPPVVWVGECSRTLGTMLAEQLRSRWAVTASPFDLADEPPAAGIVVSTYFHYNELRVALERRAADLSFVRIRPSETFFAEFTRILGVEGRRVILLETDGSFAHNVRVDLVERFGPELRIDIQIVETSVDPTTADPALDGSEGVVIVSPRHWDRIAPELRSHRRLVPLRYEIESHDLERLGVERGWRARSDRGGPAPVRA